MKKREKGFTLIELLVVIAILGVLAGVAIPRVTGALTQARINGNLANQALLASTVERYALSATPLANNTLLSAAPAGFLDLLAGRRLPPINAVDMDGTGPTVALDPTIHSWGIDSEGVVAVLLTATPTTRIWRP